MDVCACVPGYGRGYVYMLRRCGVPGPHPWVKRSRGYEGYGGYPVSEWMSDYRVCVHCLLPVACREKGVNTSQHDTCYLDFLSNFSFQFQFSFFFLFFYFYLFLFCLYSSSHTHTHTHTHTQHSHNAMIMISHIHSSTGLKVMYKICTIRNV